MDDELQVHVRELAEGWRVVEAQLEKSFTFPDFAEGLAFTNRVGALAEEAGHHPDILLTWGRVTITLWTHDAGGLTARDFAMAKQIEQVAPRSAAPPQD